MILLLIGLNAHRPTLIFLKVLMYSRAFFSLSEWRTTIEEFAKYHTATKSAIPQPFIGISRAYLTAVFWVLECMDFKFGIYARAKLNVKSRSLFFRDILAGRFLRGFQQFNFGIFNDDDCIIKMI
jgi:hypothetical protein